MQVHSSWGNIVTGVHLSVGEIDFRQTFKKADSGRRSRHITNEQHNQNRRCLY
jgi:hypothetical protein